MFMGTSGFYTENMPDVVTLTFISQLMHAKCCYYNSGCTRELKRPIYYNMSLCCDTSEWATLSLP